MENMFQQMAEQLIPVFGALLTAIASYGAMLLTKRLGIKLEEDKMGMVRQGIRMAIAGAEEWASRKAKVEQNPVSGASKGEWVLKNLELMYPKLGQNELVRMIDEELAQLKSVGATGEKKLDL